MRLARLLEHLVLITGQRDRRSLESVLTRSLRELLRAQRVSFFERVGEDPGDLLCLASDGGGDPPQSPAVLRACCDLVERLEVTLPDGSQCAIHPVFNRKRKVAGLLTIEGAGIGANDERLIEGMVRIIENYLAVLDESELDSLTGLFNRKTFDDKLLRLLARASTPGDEPVRAERRSQDDDLGLWFAILDIDHFKRINDSWGHLFGDEVLLLFAGLMKGFFRHSDLLFRYGGEEFVAVLAAPDRESACAVLERFRRRLLDKAFPQVGRVTASFGISRMLPGDSPVTVMERADQALYYAKDHGRDRVCCFESLAEEHSITPASSRESCEVKFF